MVCRGEEKRCSSCKEVKWRALFPRTSKRLGNNCMECGGFIRIAAFTKCKSCGIQMPPTHFPLGNKNRRPYCFTCFGEMFIAPMDLYLTCRVCGEEKYRLEFPPLRKQLNGLRQDKICKRCRLEEELTNRRKPHRQAKAKAYARLPHRKAKRRNEKHVRMKNPRYALYHRMSRQLWQHLKENKARRSWVDLLPYTVDDLKAHLESQFVDGMSWENAGEWHIDHIRPVSSFNYDSPDHPEFLQCWALDNLQPLWATDNCSKNAKYEPLIHSRSVESHRNQSGDCVQKAARPAV